MHNTKFVSRTMVFGVSLVALLVQPSRADVWCTLSNFIVDAYDHSGVYVHGNLAGSGRCSRKSIQPVPSVA